MEEAAWKGALKDNYNLGLQRQKGEIPSRGAEVKWEWKWDRSLYLSGVMGYHVGKIIVIIYLHDADLFASL